MPLSKHQLNLFKTVTQLNGISGQENEVARYLNAYYQKLGYEVVKDNVGSIFAFKKSKVENAPRVMIAGHMDEVGFVVTKINENGMCNVVPVGGHNAQALLAKRVVVRTNDGTYLDGTFDMTPPHLKTKDSGDPKIDKMLVDFGFSSKEEVLNAGINSGSMVVIKGEFAELNGGKRLLAKAFDDRYGIVLGIEILEHFKNIDLPFDLYVGGTVQEEYGVGIVQTATHLIKPDLAIILDCSPARDSKNPNEEHGRLGGGVLLRYLDRNMIAFEELIAFQAKMAKKAKVNMQYFYSPGGTDAGTVHKSNDGILTLTHCICARNIHSPSSIIDVEDYLAAKKSLIMLLKNIDKAKIDEFKGARH
jgi:glutamyl aminopeptidase